MTIKQAKEELKQLGITLRKTEDGQYRVNYANGTEETAYYADDITDAVTTGKAMSAEHSRKAI